MEHITPSKSDFVEYREFNQATNTEIANGKYLKIEGHGMVVGYTQTPHGRASIQLNNVLYVPEACKWLFSLIVAGQHGSVSETTGSGTTVSKNGTPYIIGRPTGGKLHVFQMELLRKIGRASCRERVSIDV